MDGGTPTSNNLRIRPREGRPMKDLFLVGLAVLILAGLWAPAIRKAWGKDPVR
jgi:hypothetical protein